LFVFVAGFVQAEEKSAADLFKEYGATYDSKIDNMNKHKQDFKSKKITSKEFRKLRKAENNKLMSAGKSMCKHVEKFIPSKDQKYKWSVDFDGDRFVITAKDKAGKVVINFLLYYHTAKNPVFEKDGYRKKCVGLPAIRFPNKWVHVLIGNFKLDLRAKDKSVQNDKTIDSIVKSFDLEGLKKL
jgi:hypothetical protein